MARKSISKLKLAVALTALVMAGTPPLLSMAATGDQLMSELHTQLAQGNIGDAVAMLKQMQAMGITEVRINGRVFMLADILELLQSSAEGAVLDGDLLAALGQLDTVTLGAPNQAIESPSSSSSPDNFPVGSAG